ncbi:MAG: homocysteine S-methyltransferase family protein [Oscillospiraceae bacterium]|nr:homocysteine S-methyltransferase family protein [Oscillospiraceae bacterium]
MKNEIVSKIEKGLLYFDGAMGTQLQKRGLKTGELPERLSLSKPEIIIDIHKAYLKAGSDVISTNTFGANPLKFSESELKEVIDAAVSCAQKAVSEVGGKKRYIALDVGPLGKLLKPFGDLCFEDAVEHFAKIIRAAEDKTDLILIETMNDAYETKAAVLAAKENSSLPIFVTCVFDEKEKLMTGADAKSMVALLEGLSVDAIGINCSLGPKKMNEVLKTFAEYSSTPLIICPNAGLPHTENGVTVFDVTAEEFALEMKNSVRIGAHGLGGCCGTTPVFIEKLIEATENMEPKKIEHKNHTLVSSYTHSVEFSDTPVIIGERINPTGKKRVKQALKENDLAFILREGLYQAEAGAEILDVNCGLPELDEAAVMKEVIESLQGALDTPLQIDTGDPVALEGALRIYNGKAIINSVNGKEESMRSVFPLAKKYGGVIVALTLDEEGIPETAEGRVEIAKKILATAESYGIDKKNIIVDTLTMSISTDKTAADVTIKAIEMLTEMGIKTTLGVSNISFGLPHRDYVNSRFFSEALARGLSSAIMNPHSENMLNAIRNRDAFRKTEDLVAFAEDITEEVLSREDSGVIPASSSNLTLKDAIVSGLSQESETLTKELLKTEKPLDVINNFIVPALDIVGAGFEEGKVYLPRLLMSAEAAKAAFREVKTLLSQTDSSTPAKKKIVIATVKGDIHDIGKNIVKILLENYGYRVIDLGKDVAEEKILEVARAEGAKLVALSALMTTTVPAMERTIKLIHKELPDCKVTVGGAVMSREYADMIEADFYSKDAMGCVRIAEKYFS